MFVLRSSPNIVRFTRVKEPSVFLTFDDGPCDETTPSVLQLLRLKNCHATFFVVGRWAQKHRGLVQQLLADGHAVYSHSIDHQYRAYFSPVASAKRWIRDSLDHLAQITGEYQPVFRPPVGIVTPPLLRAAEELGVSLVLWTHRFHDTVYPWTPRKWSNVAKKINPGEIILLHDRQQNKNREVFLDTLSLCLSSLKEKNLQTLALRTAHLKKENYGRHEPKYELR